MDDLEKFRQTLSSILQKLITTPHKYQNVRSKLIISEDRNDYLIMIWGMHNFKRTHECIVRVEICEKRKLVLIHRNHKQFNISNELAYPVKLPNGYNFGDYDLMLPLDYTISLEKIYQLHKTSFISPAELKPESDYGQPSVNLNATSAELIELANIGHDFINNEIAQHPNAPSEILIKLFLKFPVQVLTNSNLDLIILEKPNFLEQLYDSFSNCFYKRDIDLPAYFVEWASNHQRKDIRVKVASSYQIPDLLFKKLLNDDSCEVINSLFLNCSIKGETKKSIEKKRSRFIENCPKRKNRECECSGEYLPF